jgi:hypothetical protein
MRVIEDMTFRCANRILKKILILSAACVLAASFRVPPAPGAVSDLDMANTLARMLGERFSPELLMVKVRGGAAYAEMKGVMMSDIRIASMRLEAMLLSVDSLEFSDVKDLASLIGYSKGEITLLERDVNAYFETNETRGFSGLAFDFRPEGFKADGLYETSLLFTLRIRLSATGKLALKSDGVYLDDVSIFIEGVRQPAFMTNQVTSRVNPLIEWSSVPFKVVFNAVTMDDEAALMTGYPREFDEGCVALWRPGSGVTEEAAE